MPNNATKISEGNVTSFLYDKLMRVFGEGSQLFTMEMPGRTLNQLDYAYDITDYNTSILSKPYAVAEREFRLCDDLFDVSPVVQGPNGMKLSKTYSTVINNYSPDIKDIKNFVTDKMQLRLFLLQPITDQIDGETVNCTRMEFCQKLYMRYLKEKHSWDQEKLDMHQQSIDESDLDGYARWLATTAWTKDQALENLFQDAVIRGFYHEIMTILGFLDSASPTERLQTAKGNARSSVRRSLDGSMDVYPVQFQPSNWFRALSPNFSPKDLTLDPEFLTRIYQTKLTMLSTLETELGVLLRRNVANDELEQMREQLKPLNEKYTAAEQALVKQYGEGLIAAMKTIIQVAGAGDVSAFVSGENAVSSIISMITSNESFSQALELPSGDVLTELCTAVVGMYSSNSEYFALYNQIVELELSIASASTQNYEDEIAILKERIKIVSREVDELRVVLASGTVNGSAAAYAEDEDFLPANVYNEESEFTDVIISNSQVSSAQTSSEKSYYSAVDASINQFIFTTKVKHEESSASTEFVSSLVNSDFTIGFRAFKVSFDRGGWFDAGVLELAPSFRRIREKIKAGLGLTVEDVLEKYYGNSELKNGAFSASDFVPAGEKEAGYSYTLPSYPMGCLIVKDIVVKAKMSEFNEANYQAFKKSMTSSKATLFGWQLGGGGTYTATCGYQKATADSTEATFILRIPGPQIMGWFQSLTPLDNSKQYESLSESAYFNDIVDSLKEYNDKLKTLNHDHSVPLSTFDYREDTL